MRRPPGPACRYAGRHRAFGIVAIVVALLCAAPPARAVVGPCKPDTAEMMLCGSGIGAARTIPGTTSPDKRFAFAWHNPASNPDDVEAFDNEFLLIRLADGAVLATAPTDYFRTTKAHANRRNEAASWSPDSRMVVRQYDTRYSTEALTLYRIGADGNLAGATDLLKIASPAVRAKPSGLSRDVRSYAFSIGDEGRSLSNDGALRFSAAQFVIKTDIQYDFDVPMAVGKDGAARIVSIAKSRSQ